MIIHFMFKVVEMSTSFVYFFSIDFSLHSCLIPPHCLPIRFPLFFFPLSLFLTFLFIKRISLSLVFVYFFFSLFTLPPISLLCIHFLTLPSVYILNHKSHPIFLPIAFFIFFSTFSLLSPLLLFPLRFLYHHFCSLLHSYIFLHVFNFASRSPSYFLSLYISLLCFYSRTPTFPSFTAFYFTLNLLLLTSVTLFFLGYFPSLFFILSSKQVCLLLCCHPHFTTHLFFSYFTHSRSFVLLSFLSSICLALDFLWSFSPLLYHPNSCSTIVCFSSFSRLSFYFCPLLFFLPHLTTHLASCFTQSCSLVLFFTPSSICFHISPFLYTPFRCFLLLSSLSFFSFIAFHI